MRKAFILSILLISVAATSHAQTVYQKDRWGAKLLFFQEDAVRICDRWGEQILWYDADYNTIRQKDRWGTPLFFIDGNTIRQKDRWGAALYYFDFTPSLWQIACVVLL
ncbi:MAG: hypothetical protein IKU03_06725 [Bacteroidales bacterium]|nr:hypothetical protein [Bacteroidales bacterium]